MPRQVVTSQIPFSREMKLVKVAIIGPSGAGKSTLGNRLLYRMDEVEHGFVVGHGLHSETMECHQKDFQVDNKTFLQVVDTPGVPDTDPNKTLGGYDKIIKHVRRSPSLNAIIFLVALGRKEARDYRNYRTLLRQFNELPCTKVLVCRVNTNEGDRANKEMETAADELVERIARDAELENVERLILHRTNEKDVEGLRDTVCGMPSINFAPEALRTYEEIRSRYEKLSNENTRISELRAEVSDLRKMNGQDERAIRDLDSSIQGLERKRTIVGGIAIAVTTTVVLAPLGLLAFSRLPTYDKKMRIMVTERDTIEKRVSARTEEIRAKKAEISSTSVNDRNLEAAKKEFDELKSLTE